MRRFQGEKLAPGGRIAVVANDALGNYVVLTPMLQMIREQYQPLELDFYGGVRTWELQSRSDLFDWSYPLHGSAPSERAQIAKERRGYDLIVNIERTGEAKVFTGMLSTENSFVCGPCCDMPGRDLPFPDDLTGKLWSDPCWTASDLMSRYPFLHSPFIGEIFCRLAYLHGDIPLYRVPTEAPESETPYILISTAATLPEKLWPLANWRQVLSNLQERGLRIGLIGAHPLQQKQFWRGGDDERELVNAGLVEDFRGKFSLPEVAGVLSSARLVLTIDNGILHLAVAGNTPTIGLFRLGIHRLWAPPSKQLTVLVPNDDKAVADISVEAVVSAVNRAL